MAVDMALAQLVASIVASAIAYALSKSGKQIWRPILGFILGWIVGWVAGFFLGMAFFKGDTVGVQMRAMGTTFWMALIFSGVGIFLGRRKLKSGEGSKDIFLESAREAGLTLGNRSPSSSHKALVPNSPVADDTIYATIAKEIGSGAVDSGLWTRLYGECDGDEAKTKAAYIRNRAALLSNANLGTNSQEQPSQPTHGSADEDRIAIDKKVGFVVIAAIVFGLIVVVSQIGKPNTKLVDADEMFPIKGSHCQKHSDCPAGPPAQMCNLKTQQCYALEQQLYMR